MSSSPTITLFTARPPARSGPSAFVVSLLAHGTVLGMVSVAQAHATHIVDDRRINERYTLRLLEVHSTERQMRASAEGGIVYHGPNTGARAAQPGGRPAAPSSVPRRLARPVIAPQTLVQPDLPPDVVLPRDTPIPAALLWSAVDSQVKKIIPPPQQEATTADVPPSLDSPNHELNLADLKMSATSFVTDTPAPPPSTTSPLDVRGPQPLGQVPEMASSSTGPPTPARLLSISDLQLQDGITALPPANETARASSSGALVTGHGEDGSQAGSGNSASRQTGTGAGQGTDYKDDKDTGSEEDKGTTAAAGKNDTHTGASQGSGVSSASISGSGSSVNRITLPQNGRFGVVVVGSSLAEQYPQTLGLWGSRLVYTVYVHAGLAKNWILQYSVPRFADAAAAGDAVRPDAPWPFYIVVPNVASGELNADAILVHGFVNVAGRFEQLAVVFPLEFARREFVLNTLQEWQFRPAMQNGQVTAVEVLLIIPMESD